MSAALWHDHLSATLGELGYSRNKHGWCVYNKVDIDGTQCTVAFHVDDLLITSESRSVIEALCAGLSSKYGDVTRTDGPIVNYLPIDLSHSGLGGGIQTARWLHTKCVTERLAVPSKRCFQLHYCHLDTT